MLCQTLDKLFCHNLRHSLLVFDACFHTIGSSNYGKGKKWLKRTRGMAVSLIWRVTCCSCKGRTTA